MLNFAVQGFQFFPSEKSIFPLRNLTIEFRRLCWAQLDSGATPPVRSDVIGNDPFLFFSASSVFLFLFLFFFLQDNEPYISTFSSSNHILAGATPSSGYLPRGGS